MSFSFHVLFVAVALALFVLALLRRFLFISPLAKLGFPNSNKESPGETIDPQDALWLLTDCKENPMLICSVTICDALSLSAFRGRVLAATQTYPRLRQRLTLRGGQLYWEQVKDFAIETHVRRLPTSPDRPWSLSDLEEHIARTWSSQPLSKDQPLWEWHLAEYVRFNDPHLGACNVSALVWRSHHVMADGLSLMELFYSLMDKRPESAREAVGLKQTSSKLLTAAKLLWRSPFVLAEILEFRAGTVNHALSGERVIHSAHCSPTVQDIKATKSYFGVKFNDVLICALALSLMRSGLHGKAHPEHRHISILMPFSFRHKPKPGVLNNRFGMVMLQLEKPSDRPTLTRAELLRYLQHTAQALNRLKASGDAVLTTLSTKLMGTLPSAAREFIIGSWDGADAIVTNVPGLPEPFQMLGGRVHRLMAFPPTFRHIGFGLAFHTYQDALSLGISADRQICPAPSDLCQYFDTALSQLVRAALTDRTSTD